MYMYVCFGEGGRETFIVIHTEIGADDSLLNDFVSRIIMVIGKY